jgi:hypothetical protein
MHQMAAPIVVTRDPSTLISGQAACEDAILGEKPKARIAASGPWVKDMVPPMVQILARRSGGM